LFHLHWRRTIRASASAGPREGAAEKGSEKKRRRRSEATR
jgi:hypothetical protein